MKKILLTQRVDFIEDYNERRDSLDQQWIKFLFSCNLEGHLAPNYLPLIKKMLRNEKYAGILFTGGNTLHKYGGNAPERDAVEQYLINYSLHKNIPLLGICRGMQKIQDFFGVKLLPVSGHITKKLPVKYKGKWGSVNSYHTFGAKTSSPELLVTGVSRDGVIKAIEHISRPLKGFMWHPEREKPFRKKDQNHFREFFKSL
ncbi:MAG: gamma-glutamyl-gamma-aminobutyrate hydrolase family protein [Elusimicrobiota bacterium]